MPKFYGLCNAIGHELNTCKKQAEKEFNFGGKQVSGWMNMQGAQKVNPYEKRYATRNKEIQVEQNDGQSST